jgi:hypothetical protein
MERKTKKTAPNPPGEYWGLDPQDVRRHARRMREAKTVGPLGKAFRFAVVAVLLVGAFLVYWNFETLTQLRFDVSGITSAFEGALDDVDNARRGDEPGTEVVEDTSIAGVNMPTSIKGDDAPEAGATPTGADATNARADAPVLPEPPAAAAPAAAPSTEVAAARETPAPPPEPEPEEPPRPETFGFGLEVMTVSEADASARVLALRDGGRRGVAFITWWTTDGTAAAGTDFARMEPRTEQFRVGEQNRTLLVPIIGDRNREGPESFYVNFAVGESANAQPVAKIEVVIEDDD